MFLIYILYGLHFDVLLCYTLNHQGNQLVHIVCHKYRVKPIVNEKMKINIPAGGERNINDSVLCIFKNLLEVLSNIANS